MRSTFLSWSAFLIWQADPSKETLLKAESASWEAKQALPYEEGVPAKQAGRAVVAHRSARGPWRD